LYEDYIPKTYKIKMEEKEEEFLQLRQFHDDEDFEAHIGRLNPYMGFSHTRSSKLYRTLELYWKTKTLVFMGLLPKEKYFRKMKNRHKALEIQTAYVLEVIT
jgi:hypothetical protein